MAAWRRSTKTTQSKETYERKSFHRRNCLFTVGYCVLITFAALAAFAVISLFIIGNAVPLGIITGAGVASASVDQEFRAALSTMDPSSPELIEFVETINLYEDIFNFLLTGTQMLITVWDYSLGLLYLLFQIFVDVAFAIFKFVFVQFKDVAMDLLLWCVEALRIVVTAGAQVQGSDPMDTFGLGNAGVDGETSGDVFGAGTGDPTAAVTEFFVFLWNICVKGTTNLIIGFGKDVAAWLDMVFNVFLKYLAKILMALSQLFEIFDPLKLGGKWIKDMVGLGSKITKYLSPSCFGDILQNYGACIGQDLLRSTLNGIIKPLEAICQCNINNPIKKCNAGNIKNPCGGGTNDPTDGVDYKADPDDPNFGASAQCNEVDCFVDAVSFLELLKGLNMSCAFWTGPDATLTFKTALRNFSFVNSTSPAKEDIEDIGIELAFVTFVALRQRCNAAQPPFSFDIDAVADAVCIEDKSGAPVPFQDTCACTQTHPLCDAGCCDQYARHINGQVLTHIGEFECGTVLSTLGETTTWCPLMGAPADNPPVYNDLGFDHTMCNYYELVIQPLCLGNPVIKIKDLPIAGVLDAYVADTCTRLVDTVGVCIPVNTTTSAISFEVVSEKGDIDPQVLYTSNNANEFFPVPIITTFGDTASANEIIMKTVDMLFCQQFSLTYNNSNPVFAAQPWNVMSVLGRFCDLSVTTGLFIVDPSNDITNKLSTPGTNVLITGDLAGVAPGTPVFGGSAVVADDCMEFTGSNWDEINEQNVCSAQFQIEMNVQTELAATDGDLSLQAMGIMAAGTDPMNHVSGFQDIDPSDPDFDRKVRERNQTEDATDVNTDWESPDRDSLINETAPFRRNHPQTVPDGDFDDQNPAHGIFVDTKTGGAKTLKSIDPAPASPPLPAHADIWQQFFRRAATVSEAIRPHARTAAEWREEKDARKRRQRAIAVINQNILIEQHHRGEVDLNAEEDAIPFGASKGRTLLARRQLLTTGNADVDARATAVLASMSDIPTTLHRTTPQQFAEYQARTAEEQMRFVSMKITTVVIPAIFEMFYNLTNSGGKSIFGGGNGGLDLDICTPTMSDPYRCCESDTNAYQCCKGLLFCIPLIPEELFLDRTTTETADKWLCQEFDTFFEYWYTVLRLISSPPVTAVIQNSGIAEPILDFLFGWLTFPSEEIPDNTIPCLLVKSQYFFFGLIFVYALAVLISMQFLSELTIYYQANNESYDQELRMQMLETEIQDLRAKLEVSGVDDAAHGNIDV